MKKALIFGVTGQDGSYLSRLLLKKKYIVHGVIRRSSSINTRRIDDIYQEPFAQKKNFILHFGDVTDGTSVNDLIYKINPTEIIYMTGQRYVTTQDAHKIFKTSRNMGAIVRYWVDLALA